MTNFAYRSPASSNGDDDTPGIRTENDAAAELALRAAEAITLQPGGYHLIHNGAGGLELHDLTGDQWRDTPRRITDKVALTHLDSLTAYWEKYADSNSEMWADPAKRTLTAIIDAHGAGSGGADTIADWQRHRATLQLHLSDPLKTWLGNDQKLMTQDVFGEFLDEQIPYITAPPAADLQEIVNGLEVNQHAEYKSGVRLKTGARVIHFAETIEGRTRDGSLEIPDRLELRLPIWQGDNTALPMTARFRYRTNQPRTGQISLFYKLDGVKDLIDGAFTAVVATIADHISRPVFYGTPA